MPDAQSTIVFSGAGPFALPAAQNARATGGSNGVEATLYCMVPDKGPLALPIRVQMTHAVARKLADELVTAALKAEEAAARKSV